MGESIDFDDTLTNVIQVRLPSPVSQSAYDDDTAPVWR
jgi:hypothetical protein